MSQFICVGGQDATEAFFGLHLYEVLQRPQYQRLQVGIIKGEKPQLHGKVRGELSEVPYAEPTWLTQGYHSPYYKEVYYECLLKTNPILTCASRAI